MILNIQVILLQDTSDISSAIVSTGTDIGGQIIAGPMYNSAKTGMTKTAQGLGLKDATHSDHNAWAEKTASTIGFLGDAGMTLAGGVPGVSGGGGVSSMMGGFGGGFGGTVERGGKIQNRKYQTVGSDENTSPNLRFELSGPMYDLNGKCYANCAQREFAPRHNLTLGTKLGVDRIGGDWGGDFGLYGGYTLNPDYGRKQEGFKAYLGGNYGARLGNLDVSSQDMPSIDPYANAILTAGYEGETSDGSTYRDYLRGRRGSPMKWGLGAFARRNLLKDKKDWTFGGYANYGQLNLSGGYNTATGPEFKFGLGVPIRERGGKAKYQNTGNVLDPDYCKTNPCSYEQWREAYRLKDTDEIRGMYETYKKKADEKQSVRDGRHGELIVSDFRFFKN